MQTVNRIWPSGLELIRVSEGGCETCSFVRKHLERCSVANIRRYHGRATVMPGNFHKEIKLVHHDVYPDDHNINLEIKDPYYYEVFRLKASSTSEWFSNLTGPYDPISRACELLEACLLGDTHEHRRCTNGKLETSAGAASLPRRLLDLSHVDDILTIDVQEWIKMNRATLDELSGYCALSYRWGKGPPDCMLRTQPIGERVVSLSSMPQTFKDAITVARALKIRFIWIDALCIIQPSAHQDFTDWNAEGPRMWLVYQNAICTLAATCSSNPDDGFLCKVSNDYMQPCSILGKNENNSTTSWFLLPHESSFFGSVATSSLNTRGWVAQERLLSRRLLHFTEDGVFWECQGIEDHSLSTWHREDGNTVGMQHASTMNPDEWIKFIGFYSGSEFTQPSDRLVALSSIAKSVPVEQFGSTYFAGIWKAHIWVCISWRSLRTCSEVSRASCLAIAPSWSWASVMDRVGHATTIRHKTYSSWVELEDMFLPPAESKNPTGNSGKGALKITARLCEIPLFGYDETSTSIGIATSPDFPRYSGHIFWDELQEEDANKLYTVVPLIIFFDEWGDPSFNALIITLQQSASDISTEASCAVYRRIGLIQWTCNTFGSDWEKARKAYEDIYGGAMFPNPTLQTIVLI